MQIEELRDEMRAGFASMGSELAITRHDVGSLQSAVVELRGDVSELRGEVSDLRGDVSGLRGEVSDLRGDVSDLRGEVSELRTDLGEVRTGLGDLQTEVGDLRTEMRSEIAAVRTEASAMEDRLRDVILAEGKTTRRHFDVVAEDLRDSIRVIGEGYGVQTVRVDDHERRLRHLEQR